MSVYIERLKKYLDEQSFPNEVWDISGTPKDFPGIKNIKLLKTPFEYFFRHDVKLAHFNNSEPFAINYIAKFNKTLFRRRKTIITIHRQAARLLEHNEKQMVNSLNTFAAVICMNNTDKDYLIEKGITSDIHTVSPFIPPAWNKNDYDLIPPEVWSFISEKDFIVSANAFRLNFYNDEDLYGADMCVELCAKLKAHFPNIGFVFSLAGINNPEYFQKLQNRIKELGIEKNFLFTTGLPFYPILLKSRLFIRPTNTDGDALSVREALYFKIPVVASDAAQRPEGTILFKSRDMDDLYSQVKEALNMDPSKMKAGPDNAKLLLDIYQKYSN